MAINADLIGFGFTPCEARAITRVSDETGYSEIALIDIANTLDRVTAPALRAALRHATADHCV